METSDFTEFQRLSRDIRNATATLTAREARYLVDTYYQMQSYRIASDNQVRSMTQDEEPHETIGFFGDQMRALEGQIKRVLDDWTATQALSVWAKGITGIGPVIAAGLLAHIDITKAPTAGHIWRYAGLDPTISWRSSDDCRKLVSEAFAKHDNQLDAITALSNEFNRSVPNLLNLSEAEWDYDDEKDSDGGPAFIIIEKIIQSNLAKKLAKRPWNASLKLVCWKLGESFVKVSGNEKDVYGKIYVSRKQYEIERNEAVNEITGVVPTITADQGLANSRNGVYVGPDGEVSIAGAWYVGGNAIAAAQTLAKKRIGKDTDAYKAYSKGKLPPAHIHARAKRYAVKMFLSHYQEVGYKLEFGKAPPAPYPMAILGHGHYMPPPNVPVLKVGE